ncbi:tetratricopeptide repeat protein [Planktothrix agardhii]|uniref:Alpha-(1,3)-fucosyltransferase 10 n=1 Tax=Planktothrix agardhii (strain NIVA-CYA 126/8) TaxID=388467 RepID=A0A073CBT7_PLAA1|nr:tetratricopeptide repeat protein [Planktothrix agardhii]KEI65352.1 Alpha-(1,3)-fucosyltransferase 10 [Planktothrix agardhii NIVA-CYA 126/8]CAD5911484.1 TPR repeat-containing protein slr0751 [Planktothrix agardhii]
MNSNHESVSELTLEYYINLGRQYYQGQNWEAAINNYLRALELQPDYFGTYYALGYSYFQDGQWEKAIANYLKATELKPDLIDCYQNLGYAYIKLGQGYQALEYYNQLLTFEGAILYPPHNYLREMLIQWQSINFSEISHNSDRKIIKIFQADPGLYSMLNRLSSGYQKQVFSRLQEQGIEVTEDQTEADIIISQYIVLLESFARQYKQQKKYLLYTEEPRFDLNFESKVNIDGVEINIMNIYTGDVFVNNYHLCIWRGNVFSQPLQFFTDDDFGRPKHRKIVALMSKNPVAGFTTLVREGKSIDLYNLRNQIALEGHQLGKVDIYGNGWEIGITIENSRDGDWTTRKFEILQDYHFNLCFENTIAPYYCTEKIWDAIIGGCLPIYYGGKDATIYQDFPRNSFLDYSDFEHPRELFQYIENMTFLEYKQRLNLCIETFNRVGEILRNHDFYIPQRADNLAEKIRSIVF